jgi:DNA-binding MarR family transcriptional regulator
LALALEACKSYARATPPKVRFTVADTAVAFEAHPGDGRGRPAVEASASPEVVPPVFACVPPVPLLPPTPFTAPPVPTASPAPPDACDVEVVPDVPPFAGVPPLSVAPPSESDVEPPLPVVLLGVPAELEQPARNETASAAFVNSLLVKPIIGFGLTWNAPFGKQAAPWFHPPRTSGMVRGTVSEGQKPAPERVKMGVLTSLIGFRLRRAQLVVYEDFLSDAPRGLTPGYAAILILVDANPEMTQTELGLAIQVDKSTFAITLNRLETRGLLRRVRSNVDRRQKMLRLTNKGAGTLRAVLSHVKRHEARVFANLSAAERESLTALLKKIGVPGRVGTLA